LKNDNTVKKLYEQAGFEKTNYSYEYFIQNNFFSRPLFLYKLEMLKETQMMRQQLETQQMMNMLRLMRANIENNNNKIVK
jgi:hypothetical protein